MRCSHCGTEVAESGTVVACPQCTRPIFPAPALVPGQVLPPVRNTPANAPIILVAGGPHLPHRRLESGGWFSRGFSAASGVLLAMVCLCALVMLVGFGVLFGGCEMIRSTVAEYKDKADAENARLTSEARRLAMPHLRKKGIVQLADDALARRDGMDVVFFSHARNQSGNLCSVLMRWEVGTFGGQPQWQLKSLMVDDELTTFK